MTSRTRTIAARAFRNALSKRQPFTPIYSSQSATYQPSKFPHSDSSITTNIAAEDLIECVYTLRTHKSALTCLRFSPCGTYFLSSSTDSTIQIHSTFTGYPVYKLTGLHHHPINTVSWSPCSNYLAVGADDGFVSIWSISEQLPLLLLKSHTHHVLTVEWSPNGSLLASGGADGTCCLFDATSGLLLRRFEAHNDIVRCVRFSTDGTLLVSSSNDGCLRYWDISSGFCLKTLQCGTKVGFGSFALSPLNNFIVAVGCLDGCVRVFDVIQSVCVMLLAGQVNTQYSLPISFLTEPNILQYSKFYNDLSNIYNQPIQAFQINHIQSTYHRNYLFLLQYLQHTFAPIQQSLFATYGKMITHNVLSTTFQHLYQALSQHIASNHTINIPSHYTPAYLPDEETSPSSPTPTPTPMDSDHQIDRQQHPQDALPSSQDAIPLDALNFPSNLSISSEMTDSNNPTSLDPSTTTTSSSPFSSSNLTLNRNFTTANQLYPSTTCVPLLSAFSDPSNYQLPPTDDVLQILGMKHPFDRVLLRHTLSRPTPTSILTLNPYIFTQFLTLTPILPTPFPQLHSSTLQLQFDGYFTQNHDSNHFIAQPQPDHFQQQQHQRLNHAQTQQLSNNLNPDHQPSLLPPSTLPLFDINFPPNSTAATSFTDYPNNTCININLPIEPIPNHTTHPSLLAHPRFIAPFTSLHPRKVNETAIATVESFKPLVTQFDDNKPLHNLTTKMTLPVANTISFEDYHQGEKHIRPQLKAKDDQERSDRAAQIKANKGRPLSVKKSRSEIAFRLDLPPPSFAPIWSGSWEHIKPLASSEKNKQLLVSQYYGQVIQPQPVAPPPVTKGRPKKKNDPAVVAAAAAAAPITPPPPPPIIDPCPIDPSELKSTDQIVAQLNAPYNHEQAQFKERLRQLVGTLQAKMIVSGSEDGGICFWNVRSYAEQALINDYFREKQQQRRAQQHSGDQIDPNIQDNAISDFVIDNFTPINFAPGELVYKLRAHHDVVGAMDIHPFLPIFITGGMDSDCCIKVWKYKGV